MHAYDPMSKELKGACDGAQPEQSAVWQAQGLTVVAGSLVPLEDYNYLGDALTAKTAVSFAADKTGIAADGLDQALVTVSVAGETPPASIEVLVGDTVESLALSAGEGTLDPISAETPCSIVVGPADTVAFKGGPLVIEAAE